MKNNHGEPEKAPEPRRPLVPLLAPSSWQTAWKDYVKRRAKEKQDLDVYRVLSDGARQTAEYYVLIVLSCLIATMGLIQGSAAVIIGAMIIAPLMTPILAFSLGVIWGDFRLLQRSFASLLLGILLAVAISTLLAFAVPISHFSGEIVSRAHPSLFDIGVALGSGALAAFGYANKKVSSALTGIAIAVALMPPLCTVGVGLGKGSPEIAMGAALLFAINLVAISLAAAVVFWLMKIHPVSEDRTEVQRRALSQILLSTALLCLIAAPVLFSIRSGFQLETAQRDAARRLSEAFPGSSVLSEEIRKEKSGSILQMTIATENDVTRDQVRALARAIVQSSPVLARADITCLKATKASAP
jgi:uncharacterized hydrophobic protein (TIGR00271 family)